MKKMLVLIKKNMFIYTQVIEKLSPGGRKRGKLQNM